MKKIKMMLPLILAAAGFLPVCVKAGHIALKMKKEHKVLIDSIPMNEMEMDTMRMGNHLAMPVDTMPMGEKNKMPMDTMPMGHHNKMATGRHDKMPMEKVDTMNHKINGSKAAMSHHKQKNCVMMKDGKMMEMKDGKTMMMDHDMECSNGCMVMTNGTMKMKDGKTHKLKNGDCVMMDGTMAHKPMKKKMKDKM